MIKANVPGDLPPRTTAEANAQARRRNARAEALIDADRVIETYGHARLDAIVEYADATLTRILTALATLRPEAAGDVFVPPPPRTGPVGALPIRAVTENDARVLATTVRAHLELVDTLHGTLGTSGFDADVRDRLERLLLDLDA